MKQMSRIVCAVILVGALLKGGIACIPRPPRVPLSVEVGYDITSPKVDVQARQAAVTLPLLRPEDFFALRAADQKTSFVSSSLPEDEEAAFKLLKSLPERMVPVTDLAGYFETVATAAEHNPRPLVILLYTDGLDDEPAGVQTSRIEAAAHRLSVIPQVKAVILVGLLRDIRPGRKGLPEMLSCLNEGATPRLLVQSQDGMNPEAVLQRIDAVRHALSSENTP